MEMLVPAPQVLHDAASAFFHFDRHSYYRRYYLYHANPLFGNIRHFVLAAEVPLCTALPGALAPRSPVKTLSNSAGLCQIDILRWGPLRSTWCMMFEHMNQVVKFSALRNNFLNTLKTTGTRLAETLAFNLFSKRQADFSKPVIFVQLEEMCSLGSSPIIDLLIVCQWLKPRLCANKLPIHPAFVSPWSQGSGRVLLPAPPLTLKVEWLWKIKIGNYSYQVGDHVLCSTGTLRYIATIVSLLHVDGRSFLQLVRRCHSNHKG